MNVETSRNLEPPAPPRRVQRRGFLCRWYAICAIWVCLILTYQYTRRKPKSAAAPGEKEVRLRLRKHNFERIKRAEDRNAFSPILQRHQNEEEPGKTDSSASPTKVADASLKDSPADLHNSGGTNKEDVRIQDLFGAGGVMRDNGALAAGRRTHQRTRPKQSTAVSTTLLVSPLNGGAEQKFPVYIDTRSPALFVPDASCGDCPSSVTKFDSGEDTAKKKVKSVTVGRLGVVSGYAVETKVAVSSSVFVNKQPVLSAYELPQNLLPSGITGYLGLGKLSLPLAKDSFLLNLLLPDRSGMSGAVTEGYFYVDYQNSAAPELVLTTSKPDASRYDANFGANWLPTLEVERYSQWFVLANSLTVANRTTSKKTDAVIVSLDFGAPSAILAPSDAYTSLMESITALPGVTNPLWVPCASVPELPTLTFDILHEQYSLTGAEYTDPDKDHKQCHLRVSADPGAPYWTLGAQFHQKYAVTYDFTQGRIALPRSSVPSWFGDNWLAVVIPGSFGVLLTAFLLFVRSQKHAAGSQFRSSPQLPAAAGSGP